MRVERRILAGALAASLLVLSSVAVRAAPRTKVVRGDSAAKIVLYDSLCDEDNALECLIAEIGCDAPGDFTASLYDFNAKDAAAIFAKGNGKGSVTAGGISAPIQVSRVSLSEHTFNWDVTATSLEKGREIWGAIWGAEAVQLQVGLKKAVLRRADVDEGAFHQVVETCGVASR